MLLVGARTSNGKSAFVINMALDLAMQGKKIMFLSLEMPVEKILERMLCLFSRTSNIDLMTGKYNIDQSIRDAFIRFKNDMAKRNMLISDCIGKDWAWLQDYVFNNMTKHPDCVIIDHVQEIRGGTKAKDAIDEYISKMREMAIRYNFALIMCCQVNRAGAEENKAPQLHHLKSTGYLEEAADTVILLHWPFQYTDCEEDDQEKFSVNVAKNRDGLTGYMEMRYKPEYYYFADW